MQNVRNSLTGGNAEFMSLWNEVCDKAERTEREWVESLRRAGFKAAHPNDGWVNRETKEFHFAYPQFNDGAGVGDLVMLGWPGETGYLRPIRLVEKRETLFGLTYWKFVDAPNS